MKILFIEDDQNKYQTIEKVIKSHFKEIIIEWKASYNSGLKELLKNSYDLILLDMSLPTYDISNAESGGELKTFAGIDILNQMERYKKKIPTVVITQFETFGKSNEKITLTQLKDKLEQLNNDCYVDLIYYNVGINTWEKEVLKKINELGEKNA